MDEELKHLNMFIGAMNGLTMVKPILFVRHVDVFEMLYFPLQVSHRHTNVRWIITMADSVIN